MGQATRDATKDTAGRNDGNQVDIVQECSQTQDSNATTPCALQKLETLGLGRDSMSGEPTPAKDDGLD